MSLTRREKKILELMAQGCKAKAISAKLEVSTSTVRHHQSNIYRKLGVTSAPQAVAKGIFQGYIRDDN